MPYFRLLLFAVCLGTISCLQAPKDVKKTEKKQKKNRKKRQLPPLASAADAAHTAIEKKKEELNRDLTEEEKNQIALDNLQSTGSMWEPKKDNRKKTKPSARSKKTKQSS